MKQIFVFIFEVTKKVYNYICENYNLYWKEAVDDYIAEQKTRGIIADTIYIFRIDIIMSTWIGRKFMLTAPFFLFFIELIN